MQHDYIFSLHMKNWKIAHEKHIVTYQLHDKIVNRKNMM